MSEQEPQKERKSLFSIQVDDIIIQRIFKTLEDEIDLLKRQIKLMQDDIVTRPNRHELQKLNVSVTELQQSSQIFTNKIDSQVTSFTSNFNSSLEETRIYCRDQVSEAVFSVNNVVRAQNALIEEKVFEMSRPSLEFTAIQADVERLKAENKDLKTQISEIAEFFSAFLVRKDGNGEKKKTLGDVINDTLEEDRNRVTDIENKQAKHEEKINQIDSAFYRAFGSYDMKFPTWGIAEKKSFAEKPKLPVCEHPMTFIDYFKWMMDFGPNCQKIFNTFYHQMVSLSNSVYDREESDKNMEEFERSLQMIQNMRDDIDNVKDVMVSKDQIELLSAEIDIMRDNSVQRAELQQLKEQIDDLALNAVQKDTIEEYLAEFQHSFATRSPMTVDSPTEEGTRSPSVQEFAGFETRSPPEALDCMSASSAGADSRRFKEDPLPAIAAVTPRGKASFKMIYGDKEAQPKDLSGRPSTSRVLVKKKEMIEEPGRQPRKVVKPPSRIQIPDDHSGRSYSSYGHRQYL